MRGAWARSRSALAAFFLGYASVGAKGDVRVAVGASLLPAAGLLGCASRIGGSLLLLLAKHLLEKFFARAREDLLNVLAGLGASLEALVDAVLLSKLHSAVKVDFASALQLTLVANQVNADVFGGVLPDLFEPAAKILESLVARDIVGQEDTMGASVENPRDRLEGLLSGLSQTKGSQVREAVSTGRSKREPCGL